MGGTSPFTVTERKRSVSLVCDHLYSRNLVGYMSRIIVSKKKKLKFEYNQLVLVCTRLQVYYYIIHSAITRQLTICVHRSHSCFSMAS